MRESNLAFRVITKLKRFAAAYYRKNVVANMVSQNSISACSIIASNCIGGIFSHDLHLRFDSPTVNLYFTAEDFIRFSENLEHFLSIQLTEVQMNESHGYPIGNLDGIKLNFVHYRTCQEAMEKWETRKRRVDFGNLFFIFTDRNGVTKEILERYIRLPYKKIVFVSKKEYVISGECIYIPGFENNGHVPEMDKFADWKGHRFYEKYCDITAWLNGKNNFNLNIYKK